MNYPYYQPTFQQPQYQPLYAPQSAPSSQTIPMSQRNPDERIWVQGEAGANAYLVAPNGFVRLWDSQQPVFYEKRADQSGRPITEVFTYSKKSEQKPSVGVSSEADELSERLKELDKRISRLERGNVREVKGDVQQRSNAKSICNDSKV